tara:strand:+ start:3233 stop:3844 length:612 start_codon:yes stop_codon:yes gene_type:complete
MSKRKFDDIINFNPNKNKCVLDVHYTNESLPNTNVFLKDNHIYFESIINTETIDILIHFIKSIITNSNNFKDSSVYIHINSNGGSVGDLIKFMEFKNNSDIEIISIIQYKCNNTAILFASLCDYRIICKKTICVLNKYVGDNMWGQYIQCNKDEIERFKQCMLFILNTISYKVTEEKMNKYFSQDNCWNAKKMKKIGFVDEIV